jgi:hypothetical protein
LKFYQKIIASLIVLILPTSLFTLADAAFAIIKPAKVIKVLPIKPIFLAKLTGRNGDQISDALIANGSIIITGTVEGETGDWVNSPALGGSDGFISAVDFTGKRLWDLRLGTQCDDLAISLAKDRTGNFWLLGASNATGSTSQNSPAPTTSTSPSASSGSILISTSSTTILNPDNVTSEPMPTVPGEFRKIMVWEVDPSGHLLNNYFLNTTAAVSPSSLSFDGTQFIISGQIVQIISGGSNPVIKNFTVTFNPSGSFGELVQSKFLIPQVKSSLTATHGTTIWKTFISATRIVGLPSWNPKQGIPVLIQYSKSGKILDARYFSGKALFLHWQSKPGLVLLSEQSGGFGLTIVNPLAS